MNQKKCCVCGAVATLRAYWKLPIGYGENWWCAGHRADYEAFLAKPRAGTEIPFEEKKGAK